MCYFTHALHIVWLLVQSPIFWTSWSSTDLADPCDDKIRRLIAQSSLVRQQLEDEIRHIGGPGRRSPMAGRISQETNGFNHHV